MDVFIYLLNFFIHDTSPRTWCASGTGKAFEIAFLVTNFLEAVDHLEIRALKNSVKYVVTNGKEV